MAYSHRSPVHPSWKAAPPTRSRGPIAPSYRRRYKFLPRASPYLLISFILISLFWFTHRDHTPRATQYTKSSDARRVGSHRPEPHIHTALEDLPCRHLPGADDVLVVLKTGSTELADKLPVHVNTTLRCYPHHIIFSDYEEDFEGEHIYDALEFVSPSLQDSHADFELWRRLRSKGGRSALLRSELSGPISKPQGATGKPSNPGWKLDKWKFLPMMNRTLNEYPDMKWYVFVETDTYLMWHTVLNYLAALDHTKPIYMGGQIWIGDVLFAHGGTGFAISRPAMELQVHQFQRTQAEWEAYTEHHWAGDCVLGKAMRDSGAPLTSAWPIWQEDHIGNMNYIRDEGGLRLWCVPTVTYHHLSPEVVEDMWNWEQQWMRDKDPSAILHHHNVYEQYVLPRVMEPKQDWDNHADEDQGPVDTLEQCRDICTTAKDCVQYALSAELRCLTTARPNMGEWARGIDSGWIYSRMKAFHDDAKTCKDRQWITP